MEVKGMKFFELKTLRHLCRSSVAKFEREKEKGDHAAPNSKPMVLVSVNESTGNHEYLRVGMVSQMVDERYWQQPELVKMMDQGVPLKDIILPLSLLPTIDKATAAILPFQRPGTKKR